MLEQVVELVSGERRIKKIEVGQIAAHHHHRKQEVASLIFREATGVGRGYRVHRFPDQNPDQRVRQVVHQPMTYASANTPIIEKAMASLMSVPKMRPIQVASPARPA